MSDYDREPPVEPTQDYNTFQANVFSSVVSTVQAAGALAAQDIDFQRSSDPEFARSLDATNKRVLDLINMLLKSCTDGVGNVTAPTLEDVDDVENKWSNIVEIADALLEKADTCLDEYTGAIKKQPENIGPPKPATPRFAKSAVNRGKNAVVNMNWAARNMEKPQLLFDVKPDNNTEGLFRPLLTVKPHATVTPLNESFVTFTNPLTGKEQFAHPYKGEIEAMEYPPAMYESSEPIMYMPWEDTEPVWVDEPTTLLEMLSELKQATEIAVDLEHHDQRSYIGFVCLMQISTRNKDWIVDTLKLRGELQILNEVFADPKIIKVLHGAYMDIVWLQRDFGLYVVGLFDTYFAARSLGLKGHGLAFLLKEYVDFDAEKQYQIADWRIRPLPEEMITYARSDTHFLLYIFDNMRNELLKKSGANVNPDDDKMRYVLTNSKETSLRLYEREQYDLEKGEGSLGWANMLGRSSEKFDFIQQAVFKAVHQWRDTTARNEDEGHHFIMPRQQLFNLARKMPTDVEGVMSCCRADIRNRAGELVVVIRNAKNSPEVQEWKNRIAKLEAEAALASAPENKAGNIDIFNIAVVKDLRANSSDFWGQGAVSSNWTADTFDNSDVKLAVPLPPLTAEVFVTADTITPKQQKPVDPGARAEHEYIKNRPAKKEDDSIMVIRSAGGSRKRKIEEVGAPITPSTPTTVETSELMDNAVPLSPDIAAAKEAERAERKREKRRLKKEKKARREVGVGEEEEGEEGNKGFKPFDYASAPSVLNSKPSTESRDKKKKDKKDRKDKRNGGKDKGEFKPYAEEGGGSELKGIRVNQGQRERPGKSFTFKD